MKYDKAWRYNSNYEEVLANKEQRDGTPRLWRVQGRGRGGQLGEDHHQAGGRQQEHLRGESSGGGRGEDYQVVNK